MISMLASKYILPVALVIVYAVWVYVWHYIPMHELEVKREEVNTLKIKKKTGIFESRFAAIKERINTKKEDPHEEVNLTAGSHTVIID